MADDDIYNALADLPGDTGDEARSQFDSAPLATESQADVSNRQDAAATATRQYGRIKAADLNSRGIANYQDTSGDTKPYTDSTGAALTDSDPKNGVAYDSTGNPVTYSSRNPTHTPVVQDAYANAPTVTDKQGNIYKAPQGLPWVWQGMDPDVQAAAAQKQTDQLNQQASTALAPYEQQAKVAVTQATKAVNQSAKATQQALTQAGATITDSEGQPIDLKDVDGPTLKGAIEDSFNKEYAAPAANDTGWFSGSLSSSAQAIRADIDNRKQQAMTAADAHIDKLTAAQAASDNYDQIQQQRVALQSQKLASVNASRVAAGLAPVSIPGLEDHMPDNSSQAAGPTGNAGASGSGPTTGASGVPGLEQFAQGQPATVPPLAPEDHQKLAAALPAPARQALQPPKIDANGKVQPEGFWATAGRAFGTNIIPAAATALGGLGAGALAIESGPGAIAADIAGGALAGGAAAKAQRAVMGDQWAQQNQAQMAANAQAHPVATQIGTIVPFLISILGGGGAGAIKNAAGEVVGKAITAEGKAAVEDAIATGAQAALPKGERVAQALALGGRAGAAEGTEQPGATVGSVADSAAKGSLMYGATALLPAAKVMLSAAGFGKAAGDAAAMALAGQIYDSAIHGQPFDINKVADQTAGNLPAFVIQHALLAFLTHGMAEKAGTPAPPEPPGEKVVSGRVIPPDEGGGLPALPAPSGEPPSGGAPPEEKKDFDGFTKPIPPKISDIPDFSPESKLNVVNQRQHQLDILKANGVPEAQWTGEAATLAQQKKELVTQINGQDPEKQAAVESAEKAVHEADPQTGHLIVRAMRDYYPDLVDRRQALEERLNQIKKPNETPPSPQPGSAPAEEEAQTAPAGEAHREEAQPEIPGVEPKSFKTSQGSEYAIDANGNTTRLKKSVGRGQGEVHDASPAAYISPEGHEAIMQAGQAGHRVVLANRKADGSFDQLRPESGEDIRSNDDLHVLAINRGSGAIEAAAKASTTPSIGTHPFEISYKGDEKSYHMGNAITEMSHHEGAQPEIPGVASKGEALFPTESLAFRGGDKVSPHEVTRVSKITNDQGKEVYRIHYERNGNKYVGYSDNPAWEAHENFKDPGAPEPSREEPIPKTQVAPSEPRPNSPEAGAKVSAVAPIRQRFRPVRFLLLLKGNPLDQRHLIPRDISNPLLNPALLVQLNPLKLK
jgi:hypothetical protein